MPKSLPGRGFFAMVLSTVGICRFHMLVTEITLRKNHERQLIFNIYLRNFLGYVATKEFEKMLDELTLGVTMNVLWTSCLQGYESWANQSTLMKKKIVGVSMEDVQVYCVDRFASYSSPMHDISWDSCPGSVVWLRWNTCKRFPCYLTVSSDLLTWGKFSWHLS